MEMPHDDFIADLQSKLEQQTKCISNLEETNKELEATKIDLHNEVMVHQEEKNAALSQIQQLEASVKNLENQLAQQLESTTIMQNSHGSSFDDLETMLEKQAHHISNLEKTNIDLEASKTILYNEFILHKEEKNRALSQLQQVEASVKNLETQLEQELQKTSHMEKTHASFIADLESKFEQQAKHISRLEETNKELDTTNKDLYNEVMVHQEDKTKTLSQVQQLEASVKNLENQLSQQLEKLSMMQNTHDAYINDLESTLERHVQHIANLEKINKDLEDAKGDIYNVFTKHKEEKTAALAQLQHVEASMKDLESQLDQEHAKIFDMKKKSEDLLMENSNLQNKIIELQVEKNEAIADLESKLKQQDQHLSNLQDTNKDLESAKIAAFARLQQLESFVKNMEKQLDEQSEEVSHLKKTHDDIVADLKSKLEQHARQISKLEDTNKELEAAKANLSNEVVVHQDGKTMAITQLQQLEDFVKNLENQMAQQLDKISVMQNTHDASINDLESTLKEQDQHIANLEMTNKVLEGAKTDLYGEVIVHKEEKSAILDQLQQAEAYMKNLDNQLEQEREKNLDVIKTNESLLLANFNLQNEIIQLQGEKKEMVASIVDLESKLEQQAQHLSNLQDNNKDLELAKINLCNEIMVYQEEKNATLIQLQQAEANVKNIECQLEEQLEIISQMEKTNAALVFDLESKLEQQAIHISNLQETNQKIQAEKIDLSNEVRSYQEEKIEALEQLKQLEAFVKNLENQLEQEFKKVLVMQNTHDASISDLQCKLEQQAQDISTHEKTNKDLEAANIDLHTEVRKHKEEKNVALAQLQHVEASMKDLEIKLEHQLEKCANMEKTNEALMFANNDLQNEIMVLQGEKNKALASIVDIECKIEQQSKHVSNLQDTNKNLEAERMDISKENTKLCKHVQDLDIQLQLVKQKLKVTEVENKWKEERYAATVETLQAKIKNLEQLVSLMEETLEEAKERAELGVFSLVEKIDELESSFPQGFTRFVYRSSTGSEELKVLRKQLQDHLDEQREILKKKDVLAIRSRDREKVLSEMVKNDAEARILEEKVHEEESETDRTNYMTIFSRRWPIVRKGRRNSYSAGEKRSDQVI